MKLWSFLAQTAPARNLHLSDTPTRDGVRVRYRRRRLVPAFQLPRTTMTERSKAIAELTQFWLQARHGCLIDEVVTVPVPYALSHIDLLAVRRTSSSFRSSMRGSLGLDGLRFSVVTSFILHPPPHCFAIGVFRAGDYPTPTKISG
jgi:hypothetical protein